MKKTATLTAWPALLTLIAGDLLAADLKQIDRSIKKEPEYQSKPAYCLLVFGYELRTRVWLVADGDRLYVDRNGDGDLTDAGEAVSWKAYSNSSEGPYAEERYAKAGDIIDGDLKHTDFMLYQRRVRRDFVPQSPSAEDLKTVAQTGGDALVYSLSLGVERQPGPDDAIPIHGRFTQYAGCDGQGYLQFAETPQDAPVIHFDGPFEMGLMEKQALRHGDPNTELRTVVGTPGIGAGSFASVSYLGLISESVKPKAEIVFPAKRSGEPPIHESFVIKHRC